MWGIDPSAGASQTRRLTGIPEGLARRVCHRHRAVKSVGAAIRARICAILLGRPLLGPTCQIP